MPMQKKSVTIDGTTYDVSTLDGYSALPVFDKIAKVLAPTINALSSSGAALAALSKEAGAAQIAVLGKLATSAAEVAFRNMNVVDLRYCIDQFAERTSVRRGDKNPQLPQVFAELYAGNLTAMWKWFYFCVQLNFGDFSDLASEMLRSMRDKKNESSVESVVTGTSPSASPATSTPASSG